MSDVLSPGKGTIDTVSITNAVSHRDVSSGAVRREDRTMLNKCWTFNTRSISRKVTVRRQM